MSRLIFDHRCEVTAVDDVIFYAEVGGIRIKCIVSSDFMADEFHGDRIGMQKAFDQNAIKIYALAQERYDAYGAPENQIIISHEKL